MAESLTSNSLLGLKTVCSAHVSFLRSRTKAPSGLTQHGKLLEDGQLEMHDIILVYLATPIPHRTKLKLAFIALASTCLTSTLKRLGTHPILGRTPDKRVLRPTRRGISFDRVSTRPDQIEQPGELDDQTVVVVLRAREKNKRSHVNMISACKACLLDERPDM
jgi:hypothetical protein